MKTVVTNPYHLWAHQTQDHARNSSGNRSFRGANAYSYAATIGHITYDPKGNRVYLVSSDKWTATTNKHQSELRRAIPNDATVYYVPSMGTRDSDHQANMWHFLNKAYECFKESQRARGNALHLLDEALWNLATAKDYKKRFKVKGTSFTRTWRYGDQETLKMPSAKVLAFWESKRAGYTVKAEAAQVKLAEQRQRRHEQRQLETEAWIARNAQDQAERIQKALERVESWIAGESVPVHLLYSLPNPVMRLKVHEVETSQGATVPASHVKKVAPLVVKYLESGRTFKCPPDSEIRLGHYRLSEITEDGMVIIGCHRFTKAEILRFAPIIAAYEDGQ